MPGSKIILPSSDVEEYSGIALCSTISRILILGGSNNIEFLWLAVYVHIFCRSDRSFQQKSLQLSELVAKKRGVFWYIIIIVSICTNNKCAFSLYYLGHKPVTNGITAVHRRKVLAAFLKKCPEQYTM